VDGEIDGRETEGDRLGLDVVGAFEGVKEGREVVGETEGRDVVGD